MATKAYVVQRLLLLVPTLFGVTVLVYVGIRLLPGNIVDEVLQGVQVTPQVRAQLERSYHIHEPVAMGYLTWVGDIARGDFGISFASRAPVTSELRQRLPVTFELGMLALLISIVVSIPVGALAALKQGSIPDFVARSLAIGMLSLPSFWLALLVITYGFSWFHWAPPLRYESLFKSPSSNLKIMVAPALIVGAQLAGTMMRYTRSAVLDVLRQDYVRTAHAKGLASRVVVARHVLRNSLTPIVTVIGLRVGVLLGGTVILEQIFSLPGIGSYLITSIQQRDYPVVEATVLLTTVPVILTNLLVDLSYPFIDPRIRFS